MPAESRFVPQESHQAPPNDSRRIVTTDVPDYRLRRDDDHLGSQDLMVGAHLAADRNPGHPPAVGGVP